MPPPVEIGEQDGIAVSLIVAMLLMQVVADEVVPLMLADCFG